MNTDIAINTFDQPLAKVVQDYLDSEGWDDIQEITPETLCSTVCVGVQTQGQNYRLYIETNDESEQLFVFLYNMINVPEQRLGEATNLVNHINRNYQNGWLAVSEDGGPCQFKQVYVGAPDNITVEIIDNMVCAGLEIYKQWSLALAVVALGENRASEVIAAIGGNDGDFIKMLWNGKHCKQNNPELTN